MPHRRSITMPLRVRWARGDCLHRAGAGRIRRKTGPRSVDLPHSTLNGVSAQLARFWRCFPFSCSFSMRTKRAAAGSRCAAAPSCSASTRFSTWFCRAPTPPRITPDRSSIAKPTSSKPRCRTVRHRHRFGSSVFGSRAGRIRTTGGADVPRMHVLALSSTVQQQLGWRRWKRSSTLSKHIWRALVLYVIAASIALLKLSVAALQRFKWLINRNCCVDPRK